MPETDKDTARKVAQYNECMGSARFCALFAVLFSIGAFIYAWQHNVVNLCLTLCAASYYAYTAFQDRDDARDSLKY